MLLLVVMLLFGGGRVSSLMGDVAKGIKSFKKGLSDDEDDGESVAVKPTQRIDQKRTATSEGQTIEHPARNEQKHDG